jgi:hypothetical protein
MMRGFGILLMVLAVALVVYDAALYFRGGASWAITSVEKLWQMAGAESHFALRSNLAAAFGSVGDLVADLPAVALFGVLGLVLIAFGGRRSGRASADS